MINSKPMVMFRKYIPYKIRLIIGFIFWIIAVVPAFVIIEAMRGASNGWKDAKELLEKAK